MPRLREVLEKAKGKMGEKSEVMIITMHCNDVRNDDDYDKDEDDYHNGDNVDDETNFHYIFDYLFKLVIQHFSQVEKRLLEEKEESPAKKLKLETKATKEEEVVEKRKNEFSLEEKVNVKKAQNVREKLAEMKKVYVEDMEDDVEDGDEEEEDLDDDVVIEKATLSEDAKIGEEKEGIVKEQISKETNCQVINLFSPWYFNIPNLFVKFTQIWFYD